MAVLTLGDLSWRIDPSEITFSYKVDVSRQETLGGQVVQILGTTMSDVEITGLFGQDSARKVSSWQLAEAFHRKLKQLVDSQTLRAKAADIGNSKTKNYSQGDLSANLGAVALVHAPLQFSFLDGVHNWKFRVLIKAIADQDGNGVLVHRTGKFSYGYRLTLFVVQSESDVLKKVAADAFLSRLNDGLGWARTKYNGPMETKEAVDFIQGHGGTIGGFLTGAITGVAAGAAASTDTSLNGVPLIPGAGSGSSPGTGGLPVIPGAS